MKRRRQRPRASVQSEPPQRPYRGGPYYDNEWMNAGLSRHGQGISSVAYWRFTDMLPRRVAALLNYATNGEHWRRLYARIVQRYWRG